MTCGYCVQWRCSACKSSDCPTSDDPCVAEAEPYWPDGSVAVITEDSPCATCAEALNDMEGNQ